MGSTRPQKGHSKSENSWMTTFAVLPPRHGFSAVTLGAVFFSGGGGGGGSFPSFMISS